MATEKEMVFWGCVLFCMHEVIIAHQSMLHLCDANVYGHVLYMLLQMYSVCACVCVCVRACLPVHEHGRGRGWRRIWCERGRM